MDSMQCQSNNGIDEPSRLKQFAWEQVDHIVVAVIFRSGPCGPSRFLLKRYAEQLLYRSQRWKQLSSFFSYISPPLCAYKLTSYEQSLLQHILDFHLKNILPLRVSLSDDELIEYEALLDFEARAQDFRDANVNIPSNTYSTNGTSLSLPTIRSSYVIPALTEVSSSSIFQSTIENVDPINYSHETIPQSNIAIEPTTTTKTDVSTPSSSSAVLAIRNKSEPLTLSESNAESVCNKNIHASGLLQINKVLIPFIIRNLQRFVPYNVLVYGQLLKPGELQTILTCATTAEVELMNTVIRNCKISNQHIPTRCLMINIHYFLVNAKDIFYVKVLPENITKSTLNYAFEDVLSLSGGSLYIRDHLIPFVRSKNRSYIPFSSILNIDPIVQTQLQPYARTPSIHELGYLELVQIYHNEEKLLPSNTLIIDIEDLRTTNFILTRFTPLARYCAKEKHRLEQKLNLLKTAIKKKRKQKQSSETEGSKKKLSSNRSDHSSSASECS